MKYIRGISFPRSGHHLLVRLLEAALPDGSMRYIARFERDARPRPLPPPALAERVLLRLGLARRLEATLVDLRPGSEGEGELGTGGADFILSKNHDFGLAVANDFAIPTLIQIRSPLPATVSNYYLYYKEMGLANTEETWRAYARPQIEYWRAFVQKWILDSAHPESCVVSYEDLVTSPTDVLGRVIRFLLSERAVDPGRIAAACAAEGVKATREVGEFEYFDAVAFSELERSVASQMRSLGLPVTLSSK